jgi:hypothetical protein
MMDPSLILDIDLDSQPVAVDQLLVHEWRTGRLRDLGLPRSLAEDFADQVDWHVLAALVERGCPAELALEIVR